MERSDRRTFLANGLKTGALLAVSGAVATGAADLAADAAQPAGGRPGRPISLWVNGVPEPVGVDPDDVNFSWRVADRRRGARQGAWQVAVWPASAGNRRPGRPLWDSGQVQGARQAFVHYAGPSLAADTEYRWSVTTTDHTGARGPWSAPAVFVTGLRDKDWVASWLRPGPAGPVPEEYAYLRTVVHPSASPIVRATAYVAAAHKYQLWANGTMAATGPCFAFPDESYYQATDVTHLLAAGRPNAVGLLHHWYGAGNGRPAAVPGALLQLSVHHADGTREVYGTDGHWKERAAEWQPAPPRNTQAHDFVEIVDGRQSPLGWSGPGYDDSGWSTPTVLGGAGTSPFTALFAQRTWITEHEIAPVSVHTLSNGAVVVDYGKILAGRPKVTFRHGRSGRTVAMRMGYLLDPDGQVSTTHGTQGTDLSLTYIQRDGAQEFVPFTYNAFRYLQVTAPGEPLAARAVTVLARHTAMPEGESATFSSSNKTLDAVWSLCAHSCLYVSHEQFVDSPTRQKGQFTCDAANESQAIMRAYGDTNQSWQGLRDFARSQARFWPTGPVSELYPSGTVKSTIPDFTELYVEWVYRYHERTGDDTTLAKLYPVVQNIAGYVWKYVDPTTGLVTRLPGGGTTYAYGIVDWPPEMRYDYDMSTVARTTVNVLGANVFNRAAVMAEILGDTASYNLYRQRGIAITNALNGRLVNAHGLYIDGLLATGAQSAHASQQANALALAYDLVPTDRVATVGAYVASLKIALGCDHGLELVRALHAAGLDADLVRIVTDPKGPGWAHILASGGTFCWESWTPSDLEQDSLSHGWGSGALVGLHEALLGVTVTGPMGGGAATTKDAGLTYLEVRPPSGGLEHAAGTLPTIAGPVAVRWSKASGTNRLRLALSLPANARAQVVLPASAVTAVTESGRPVTGAPGITSAGASSGKVDLIVGAGTYRFTVSA
jgi:alpha-L-rhamnosidase